MALCLLLLPIRDRAMEPAYPHTSSHPRTTNGRDPLVIDGDFRRER
jgi:hypothetical protein